jgi:hypothetical protein
MPKKPAPEKATREKKTGASRSKTNGAAATGGASGAEAVDPTSPAALRALTPDYAVAPDMPIGVAITELGSLSRLAKTSQGRLTAIGLGPEVTARVARFGKQLGACEDAWQEARAAVRLTASERADLAEAEALDDKLVAGGRWGCRKDPDAQKELSDIAEGSGLRDTVNDLRAGADFWRHHASKRSQTDVTDEDLRRAIALADALEPAAQKEEADVGAAQALELRNRCFWAADELAKEVREGGRYAFRKQPKVAARFTSRYRAEANRRSRKKAKAKAALAANAVPTDGGPG